MICFDPFFLLIVYSYCIICVLWILFDLGRYICCWSSNILFLNGNFSLQLWGLSLVQNWTTISRTTNQCCSNANKVRCQSMVALPSGRVQNKRWWHHCYTWNSNRCRNSLWTSCIQLLLAMWNPYCRLLSSGCCPDLCHSSTAYFGQYGQWLGTAL